MRLDADGLIARYRGGSPPALDGVSVAVAPGQLLAVVGPNGSGKTTLMRALLGLMPLEAGIVRVDGRPLATWTRRDLARAIGAVPQREEPMPLLTVADAVLFGRYARLGALAPIAQADRLATRTALERCDAWPLRDRGVDTLSGGEWQRVRLARALAQEPGLLILDEPTAALDVRHEMELLELARRLVNEGLGALIITHHLNIAARYADRMLLLHRGRVAGEGTPGQLLRQDLLAEVFAWPVAVTTWCDGSPQVVPLRPGEAAVPPSVAATPALSPADNPSQGS